MDLPIKWKIYDIFHVSLLEDNTTRKEWMNKLFSKLESEFDIGNNKEYKVEAMIDSAVYAKKAKGHLLDLYYFVFWKGYQEKESTWEPSFAVMHFWKMIFMFHKNHPEKLMASFPLLNSALPMAKPSVKPAKLSAKQKQGHLTGSMKQAKK